MVCPHAGGVEVVVIHHAIDIIVGDNFGDDIYDSLCYLGNTGIEVNFLAVAHKPIGVRGLIIQGVASSIEARRTRIAIGIEPRVHFDAYGMGFVKKHFEGILDGRTTTRAGNLV